MSKNLFFGKITNTEFKNFMGNTNNFSSSFGEPNQLFSSIQLQHNEFQSQKTFTTNTEKSNDWFDQHIVDSWRSSGVLSNTEQSGQIYDNDVPRFDDGDINISSPDQETTQEETSGLAEEGSGLGRAAGVGTLIAGTALSTANNAILDSVSNHLTTNTLEGRGASQHGLLTETTANMQAKDMQITSGLAGAAITIGSLFGPEGMVAGAIGAAGIDAIGSIYASQDDAQVNTTSGDLAPA